MQVFGLPGHLIRNAGRASRLLGAETSTIEAERRRDAVARWRRAMDAGLSADDAAAAVGVPRSTLYRWKASAAAEEPASAPTARQRLVTCAALCGRAAEMRLPMWGKDKLGPLLRKAGMAVSNATVGRILKSLVERGRVMPVPQLIRKQARKAAPKSRPHAIRKPKDVFFEKPGDVIQIDTVTLALAQGRTVKHFDAYDVFAEMDRRQTLQKRHRRERRRLPRKGRRRDALAHQGHPDRWRLGVHGRLRERLPGAQHSLHVLPPKLNGAVERCNAAWRYEFYATVDLPPQIDKIAEHVEAFQHLYNASSAARRPRRRLTPNEYLHICRNRMTQSSHMC